MEVENAAPTRFGAVIGADGAHSGTRRLVFGPEEPFLRYIASSGADLAAGISRYEDEVREYVLRDRAAARLLNDQTGRSGPGDFPDFGTMVEDLPLKNYPSLLSTRSDH